MKTKVFLTALFLTLTISFASAQTTKTEQTKATTQTKKSCFTDANNNGICDKFEDKTCTVGNGRGLQDGSGKGQGLHDGSGRKNSKGKDMGHGKKDGTGRNNGGKGAGFVDANNNGVCDHKETK